METGAFLQSISEIGPICLLLCSRTHDVRIPKAAANIVETTVVRDRYARCKQAQNDETPFLSSENTLVQITRGDTPCVVLLFEYNYLTL